MRFAIALGVLGALVAACGHVSPQSGPAYVCYPVDAGAEPAPDAGDPCQEKAPSGCVLEDLSVVDQGGGYLWCCVDQIKGSLRCCPQP